MTITIAAWMIPTGICLLLLAWAFLMPLPEGGGDYNFAPALSALFRVIIVIIASLITWLAYFAIT